MPNESPLGLKERLKQLRIARQRTLEEVGRAVGAEKQSVHGWESGKSKPSLEAIIKLAAYYDVTTDALLGVSPEQAGKIRNLAKLFSGPASAKATEMYEKMLSAGYSEKQIQRFIEIAVELAGLKRLN